MTNRWLDTVGATLEFRGYSEPGMLEAAERGVNTVYWVMVAIALPPALWQHVFTSFRIEGLLYIVVPLLYAPVALGWFPRSPVARLYIASGCFMLVAVSINSLNDWRPQPGLYLMIPSALILFCIHGARGLVILTGLQLAAVGATSGILGISAGVLTVYDLLTSLALWIAVVIACAMLVRQILDSSRYRARELETLTDQLWESEARLRDNTLSTQRIVRVSLEAMRDEIAEIDFEQRDAAQQHLKQVEAHIDTLRASVIPQSVIPDRADDVTS